MAKRILLISPDKNVPNVALMKLSAWHKQQGDTVMPLNFFLGINDADKIYVSIIFPNNYGLLPPLPSGKTEYGGIGYDLIVENDQFKLRNENISNLPPEIDHIKPDYGLYSINYSMGFTSRGCIRSCPWCAVPLIEGRIRPTNDVYEFLEKNFESIRILDNNPLALHEHFAVIAEQIIKEDKFVIFDGLDARVLTDKSAELLGKLKTENEKLKFALDAYESINSVEAGIHSLIKYNVMNKTLWYVLLDFGEPIEQELARIKTLMRYNASIYPMFFNNKWKETDKLIKHYPMREVLKMRTDQRMYQRFMRYLAYKLGLYHKYRHEIDDKKLNAFQNSVYAELGWQNGRFIGMKALKEQIKEE